MKIIKFRAWDGLNITETFWLGGMPEAYYRNNPSDLIFMQYTGLKDKNGADIYEGDIVKSQFGEISEVKFETEDIGSCGCCFDEFRGSGFIYKATGDIEVIGNIYQNKDLIK